jgi:hypothetical protein
VRLVNALSLAAEANRFGGAGKSLEKGLADAAASG